MKCNQNIPDEEGSWRTQRGHMWSGLGDRVSFASFGRADPGGGAEKQVWTEE